MEKNLYERLNFEYSKVKDSIKLIQKEREEKIKEIIVCVQLPDGLKPYAKNIQSEIERMDDDVIVILWGGSCFGGCDQPIAIDALKNPEIDLFVQFGHNNVVGY